ncbi:unnamed protein product [Bathycoccus prasinos]
MKVTSKLEGVRFRTRLLHVPSSAEPDPREHEFLRFVRPEKCIRKCENKEKLLPANSKFGYCSFNIGKFSRTWNASSAVDFLSCQEAIHELNHESSFKNVLWLDTDCFPLVDPLELFQNENFKEKGAMFWPDLTGDQCDPQVVSVWPSASSEGALWNAFNLRFNADNWKHVQEFESGQMMIDSELHLRALHLAYFLTENGIFQQFAYGDKEAFRWSWLAQDLDYYFSEYPAFLSYHNQFDQASKQCYLPVNVAVQVVEDSWEEKYSQSI